MILGPIHPCTKEGLWSLIHRQPDVLERGLCVVAERLELTNDALGAVDGVARDAADSPVLLLAAAGDRDPALLPRILAAHAFMMRNRVALGRALPDLGIRFGAPFRIMVVGIDVPRTIVERLEALALDGVELLEVETFRLGGEQRLVVRRTVEAAPVVAPAPSAGEGVEGVDGLGQQCAGLLDLLARLDPAVEVDGDRFSRRIAYHGRTLLDLWLERGQVMARVPGGEPVAVIVPSDDALIADSAMRRYLDVLGELERPSDGQVEKEAETRGSTPSNPGREGGHLAETGRRLALDALARGVADARVSREEYSALGGISMEEASPNS